MPNNSLARTSHRGPLANGLLVLVGLVGVAAGVLLMPRLVPPSERPIQTESMAAAQQRVNPVFTAPEDETRAFGKVAATVPALSAKAKPPAPPDGFHEFRLGMARKEVHALIEQWKAARVEVELRRGAGQEVIPILMGVPYSDVERMNFRFEDGKSLALRGGVGEITRSADLEPPTAKSRLTAVLVEFKKIETTPASPPASPTQPLLELYGQPDRTDQPRTEDESVFPPGAHRFDWGIGLGFYMTVGGSVHCQKQLVWQWADVDRTVVAQVVGYRSDNVGFGKPSKPAHALRLILVDGMLAQEKAKVTRVKEQQQNARNSVRDGLRGKKQP